MLHRVASPQDAPITPLADIAPLAAVVTALAAAAAEAPLATRRSRRSAQTAGQTTVTQTPAETPVTPAAPTPAPRRCSTPCRCPSEPFELLEPVAEFEPVVAESAEPIAEEADRAASSDAASGPTAAEIDAFEAAARLFSFTGETPIQSSTAEDEPQSTDKTKPSAHVASRRNRGASFRRVTATSFSVGVMGIVGLLTVGMTMPADAVAAPGGNDLTTSLVATATASGDVEGGDDEIQAYVAPSEVQNVAIDRTENYSTVTMAQIASDSGISNFSNFFVNNPNSPIQWPFAVGVPISYGFGMRDGTMHEGVDFTPGEGSPIQAIADGVVRESTDSGGAFGVHIVIDHVIDGELISSSYSHMQYGSRQVQVGDHVTVGTIVGRTGNTGRSFGAHTHFEMLANGTTPIDPIPWLRQHAGG